ncbi:MAG: pyridoxal phosphate-dependent aminotransferase family protein, partial [Bdellovibrionales bacterium]|nr:pyridoxal phosphate-dependent aminotransferase family protein [Bdellovibrionales bacterium]
MAAKKYLNQLVAFTEAGLSRIAVSAVEGREIVSSRGRLIDYCTTSYLGFDFEPHMNAMGNKYAEDWGTLVGWSRLEADPSAYDQTEKRISKFLGVKDTILSHTITITNFSVIPAIAKKGVIFTDAKVHAVVYEATRLARDHGATLVRFEHQNLASLEAQLQAHKTVTPKLIAVDGVYSISTEQAPIIALQALCEKYDAWLYVDDAHGFGVLGRQETPSAYGAGGRGIVDHQRGNYHRTFYVSSFGKAFCTHTAFITIPDLYTEPLREQCMQYIYSSPITPYVLGLVNGAMDLNESKGDSQRTNLEILSRQFVTGLRDLNLDVQNEKYFPVVFWKVGAQGRVIQYAQEMLNQGVLAGLRAYPVV